MQKVQNMAASYVTKKFTTEEELFKLNWLPVKERIEYSISKIGYKTINDPNWLRYLPLNLVTPHMRNLRSNQNGKMIDSKSNFLNTFESIVSRSYNDLPSLCREAESYENFCTKTKSYFKDKALARISASN